MVSPSNIKGVGEVTLSTIKIASVVTPTMSIIQVSWMNEGQEVK